MQQINLVIAELQLALTMLDANTDPKRLQALLDQSIADLKAAAKAITGQELGAGPD